MSDRFAPTRPLRRLLMTADAVGGVWSYALELARGLVGHGVETVLAVLGPPPDGDQRDAAAAIPGVRLHHAPLRLEWQPGAAADHEAAGRWLLGLADTERADLVHVNGYGHAALPWDRPCVVVAHSCVATWWQAVHGDRPPADYDWYRGAVRAGLRAADLVVAPTATFLASVEAAHGPARRSQVIRNGRDAADYRSGPKEPFVLAAGRLWDGAKNVALLDAAAEMLDWPVLVAGDAEGPDGTEARFRHAVPLGRLSDRAMRAHMARAAIFAAPARYEPFGLAVLEAALSECALVLGDIPTLRELWDGAALFVDPEDAGALTATLAMLRADPGLRLAHGRWARRRTLAYATDRMVADYLDAYAGLLALPALARMD